LLTSGIAENQGAATSEGKGRSELITLRQMGQMLDRAMQELKLDSDRVVTLLVETVSNLAVQAEIGQVLRDAAGTAGRVVTIRCRQFRQIAAFSGAKGWS